MQRINKMAKKYNNIYKQLHANENRLTAEVLKDLTYNYPKVDSDDIEIAVQTCDLMINNLIGGLFKLYPNLNDKDINIAMIACGLMTTKVTLLINPQNADKLGD